MALAAFLVEIGMGVVAADLCSGAFALLISALVGGIGFSKLKPATLFPARTVNQLATRFHGNKGASLMADQLGRKTAPDFLGNLTQAMRDSPISAALIGMGALWLIAGGARTSLVGAGGKSIFASPLAGALETPDSENLTRQPVPTGVADENPGSHVGGLARGAMSTLVGVVSSVDRTASTVGSHAVDAVARHSIPWLAAHPPLYRQDCQQPLKQFKAQSIH